MSRRLRELRLARGLTQDEAAGASGVLVETISNIERGKTMPSLETLLALATGFEVAPSAFIDELQTRPSERERAESKARIVTRGIGDRELQLLLEVFGSLRKLSEREADVTLKVAESIRGLPRQKIRLVLEFLATLRKAEAVKAARKPPARRRARR